MSRSFSFRSAWWVPSSPERASAVLVDLGRYPLWWRQVRAVARVDDDAARVLCRSALPYTLDLRLHALRRGTRVLEVRIAGDLDGWARFDLVDLAGGTQLRFTQQVTVTGALALAASVARPLLAWNHARMMAGCEAGLRADLAACPADASGRVPQRPPAAWR